MGDVMGIAMTGISFAYSGKSILHNASLHLPAGQFGVILGRNGSGKSTLLRIAAGLMDPAAGDVQVGGDDLSRLTARARAERVGFLAQFHQPEFSFLVRDVVLTGRAARVGSVPTAQDHTIAEQALADLAIAHLADRAYDTLSGGERQLVMIARILAQQPKAVLLDEPVSSLDLSNQMHLLQTLRRLARRGMTVLAILHDPNHAFLFADTVFYMEAGQVEQAPTGKPLADPERLQRLYGIPVAMAEIDGMRVVVPRPNLEPEAAP